MRLLLAFFSLSLLTACGNECSFHEQCDGNVLQVCGEGADQVFGREVYETPCEDLNDVCVEIDDKAAMCAADPATACDLDTHTATCDGDVLTTCTGVMYTQPVDYDTAYEILVDCAADGMTCDELTGACL